MLEDVDIDPADLARIEGCKLNLYGEAWTDGETPGVRRGHTDFKRSSSTTWAPSARRPDRALEDLTVYTEVARAPRQLLARRRRRRDRAGVDDDDDDEQSEHRLAERPGGRALR